jgi:hypothetical protein
MYAIRFYHPLLPVYYAAAAFRSLAWRVGASSWHDFQRPVAPAGAGHREAGGVHCPPHRLLTTILPTILHPVRYRRFAPVWVPPSWRSDRSPAAEIVPPVQQEEDCAG